MKDSRVIRLLLVEDNPAYAYLVRKAFSYRQNLTQWDLTVVEDGEQAVKILLAEEKDAALPQIILLDWKLPKLSGVEVLQRLKEHRLLRRIPVLVFSASAEDVDIHAAYDGHANGYITKPSDIDKLAAIAESIERFWADSAHLPRISW
ncbi:MAG TPA: response regulator [Bryobacteraceae bacterium]|nr:response regulator [Bryobacteraceae bacterium]